MLRVKSEVMDPAEDSCNEGPVDIKEEIDIDDTHYWSLIREARADIKREQCDEPSMVFSSSDGHPNLEYKTCGKIAQVALIRLEDLGDGLDTLQKSACQGEENGCKSQSSSVHTQRDNCDGHNPENHRPIPQDEGQCSGSMDTTDGLDQDQNNSEYKYQVQHNSDDRDQCSDHNKQHLGIGERGLPVREEEMGDEHFIHYESFSTDSSNRFIIKQEHNIKEENEEDLNEMESDGGCNSFSTMMQIQDISSLTDTAIIVNFKNENNSIALDEQDLSAEGIEEQGSSTSNECADKSPDQLLFTDNLHVHSIKSYTCKYCDYRTNNKSNLSKHLHTHTGERPYHCEFCDKTFTQKSTLTTHLHTHTGERPYHCEFCDKTFTQKSTLTTHLHTHTGERPYHCEFCEKAFTWKSDLNRHLHTHTGERPYSCGNCDKTFVRKSTLIRHLHTHTGERPYHCEFCDKTFTQKSTLTTHLHTHTGERPYHCEFCEKAFTWKSDLNRHLHTHTGERPYSCGNCDKTFVRKSTLIRHLHTHTGERPYHCEFCDKTFTQKSTLTTHLHTHTGERPYHCEFCEKAFTWKSDLNRHLHTHTGERPYSCGNCDKTFVRKSTLIRHLHTHTGERPYSCGNCDKTFARKSTLTTHLHTHTGERPYSCGNCDKTFTHKSHLTTHIRCLHTGHKP